MLKDRRDNRSSELYVSVTVRDSEMTTLGSFLCFNEGLVRRHSIVCLGMGDSRRPGRNLQHGASNWAVGHAAGGHLPL